MDQGGTGGEAPFDAAIVGGSFAGLSAALYLARGRRRVVVFDDGLTRNRFAGEAHGFLGQDGRAPRDIRLAGRAEVLAYPTAELREARVTAVEGGLDGFRVRQAGGGAVTARRVILAHGMRDHLPPIPGLAECWGVTAIQCPYCHGYELADRPTGMLMTGPVTEAALHHLRFLREWSRDLLVLAHGHPVPEGARRDLAAMGMRLEEDRVDAALHDGGRLSALRLEGGREVPLAVLYVVARQEPASGLPAALGLEMADGPLGPFVRVDGAQLTSVPGVYAAGDLARPVFGAVAAAADGVAAAVACHRSLVGL